MRILYVSLLMATSLAMAGETHEILKELHEELHEIRTGIIQIILENPQIAQKSAQISFNPMLPDKNVACTRRMRRCIGFGPTQKEIIEEPQFSDIDETQFSDDDQTPDMQALPDPVTTHLLPTLSLKHLSCKTPMKAQQAALEPPAVAVVLAENPQQMEQQASPPKNLSLEVCFHYSAYLLSDPHALEKNQKGATFQSVIGFALSAQ